MFQVDRGVKSPADISMDISKLVKTLNISPTSFKDGVNLTLATPWLVDESAKIYYCVVTLLSISRSLLIPCQDHKLSSQRLHIVLCWMFILLVFLITQAKGVIKTSTMARLRSEVERCCTTWGDVLVPLPCKGIKNENHVVYTLQITSQ